MKIMNVTSGQLVQASMPSSIVVGMDSERRPMQGEVRAPGNIETRNEKLRRLRAIRDEEVYRRSLAANNNDRVREITNKIDENNRTIHKLLLANEILVQGRQSHIDDAAKEYDQQNPSSVQDEIEQIGKQEALERLQQASTMADAHTKAATARIIDIQKQLQKQNNPAPYEIARKRFSDWYEEFKGAKKEQL